MSSSLSRGGVLLNRAVDFIGDLQNITGATVDPVTGQVVLVGTGGAGGAVPDLRLDDFVTAVRAIFGSAEDPGVTIDPPAGHESDPSYPQSVHLFAGLDDTEMGWVLFEADRVMKTLVAAEDNVTGTPVGSSISGYMSVLDRWFYRALSNPGSGGNGGESRFWFVPSDVKLVRSDDGNSFVFDRSAVQIQTEDMLLGGGATDVDAESFAAWFNAHFDELASSQFTTYDYATEGVGGVTATVSPDDRYIFQRLEQAAKAIAFARFLYDNDIPIDFSWMENYQTPQRNTPQQARTVQNSRHSHTGNWSITITVTGGVSMETPNAYLPDTGSAEGMSDQVLGARPDELTQQWTTPSGTAVALSMNSEHYSGLDSRTDADLSYRTPGDVPLGLTRYYSSASPVASALGYGWEMLPYDAEFTRPEFFSSTRSLYGFLNGLRTGEIRITDRAGGRTLTFISSFITDRDANGNFMYGGVDLPEGATQAVPTEFIAGGSEQPDGSTLTQDRSTLNYTLTRPDGTRVVFDRHGRLLRVEDNRARAVAYGYNPSGQLTSITDSAGQAVTLTYDGSGRVAQAAGLDGEIVSYSYDGSGNLATADRVRQGVHRTYSYSYDADHRLTAVTLPDQVVDNMSVSDVLGRITTQQDSRGNQTDRDYDPATRTMVTTDAQDGLTETTRTDSMGRPVEVTDRLGQVTCYTYLGTNRQPFIVELPDADRPLLMYLYDDNGNVEWSFDPLRGGDVDEDGIDDNPLNFEYDGNNNLTRSTDARGLVTEYTYNSHNQRTSMTRAAGTALAATWTYEYDPATGFLHRETDPTDVVTEYDYDSRGNMTTMTVAPGTGAQTVTSYGYDIFSRRTSMTAAGATTGYAYNGWDQVAETRLVGPADLISGSAYDARGWKTGDTDALGHPTGYTHDTATGDLTQVLDAASGTTHMSYDRFGNLARLVDPAGNVTVFEYDALQRLTRTISLGQTPRVVDATASPTEVVVRFSEPINAGQIDNGTDVFVTDSAQPTPNAVPGTIEFSEGNTVLTWRPVGSLTPQNYTITLRAQAAGQFATSTGVLLDGEYSGRTPSGNNAAGGDFSFGWLVDDHGNDAVHATLVTIPGTLPSELEFQGDGDWFRIDAVAGARYHFEVVLGSLNDSVLRLYGPDGQTIIEENDDINRRSAQYGSRIEWEAPQTGTYYLSVRGYDDQEAGTYQLNAAMLQDDHGDDAAHATPITSPSVTAGNLEISSDTDVFWFTPAANQQYRIAVLLDGLEDSVLTLLGPDGTTVIAQNDDFGGTKASLLHWTAPPDVAGTHYIIVSSYDNQYEGTYELALSVDDHKDSSSTATTVAIDSTAPGNIEVEQDRDWFTFQTTAAGDYRIEAIPGTISTAVLALYDGSLNLVDVDESASPATIYISAGTGERYYALVHGAGEAAGTYQFAVTRLTDDHGNNAASATPITVPSTTAGELEKPTDQDWFSFAAVEGQRYRISVSLDTLHDSVLSLYDVGGATLLAVNDDSDGHASELDWYAPSTGIFYMAVTSYGNDYAGQYGLSIEQAVVETSPPVCAVMSPTPGGYTPLGLPYVDVSWDDLGSGIDQGTINPSDIQIGGLTFTSVEARGGGVWRYHATGLLSVGGDEVTVSLPAGSVADVAGNLNEETAFTLVVSSVSLSNGAVAENQPAGTAVGTFSTSHSEEGLAFTYNLVAGEGDDGNAWFQISGDRLLTTASFDYETRNSYSVRVQSTTGGITYAEQALTINVTNVNLPGDSNGDGSVDAADYIALKRAFGSSVTIPGGSADFDCSGTVDYGDLLALIASFGQDISMAFPAAIPAAEAESVTPSGTDTAPTKTPEPTVTATEPQPSVPPAGEPVTAPAGGLLTPAEPALAEATAPTEPTTTTASQATTDTVTEPAMPTTPVADAVAEPALVTAPAADSPDVSVLAIATSILGNRLVAGRQGVPPALARPGNSLPLSLVAGRVGPLPRFPSPLLRADRAGQVVADVLQLAGPWWPGDSARHESPDESWMTSLDMGIAGKPRKGRLDLIGPDVLAVR